MGKQGAHPPKLKNDMDWLILDLKRPDKGFMIVSGGGICGLFGY
jgi:hypothetical protein